jgi:hypothetical protein
MLTLIVVVIMLGFPTAFTLMGLGMFFGFIAFYDPAAPWTQNRIFDLMVQRTYGAMTNDTCSRYPVRIDGYVMERGALVDKMFYSVQLASAGSRHRSPCDPAHLHVLGHRERPRRRGGRVDGRHRVQADAEAGYDVRLAPA